MHWRTGNNGIIGGQLVLTRREAQIIRAALNSRYSEWPDKFPDETFHCDRAALIQDLTQQLSVHSDDGDIENVRDAIYMNMLPPIVLPHLAKAVRNLHETQHIASVHSLKVSYNHLCDAERAEVVATVLAELATVHAENPAACED